MKHTNINTIIVQALQFIPVLVLVTELAYPGPALAFSSQLSTQGLVFEQVISNASDLQEITPLRNGLTLHIWATAYTSEASLTDASPFITANGTTAHEGIIATNILPMHTKVRIGSDVYTVEDRMNSRYDHVMMLDIWMPTLQQAQAFGVRQVYAKIESL